MDEVTWPTVSPAKAYSFANHLGQETSIKRQRAHQLHHKRPQSGLPLRRFAHRRESFEGSFRTQRLPAKPVKHGQFSQPAAQGRIVEHRKLAALGLHRRGVPSQRLQLLRPPLPPTQRAMGERVRASRKLRRLGHREPAIVVAGKNAHHGRLS
jgi:hypothetical protein